MDAPSERRPSVARLAAALSAGLPDGEARGLVLSLGVIFARHLRFDAGDPGWPDRDRVLVDPGLRAVAQALSELTGAGFGPPGDVAPVLGMGVGVALAERLLAARFGRSLVDHRAWIVLPEACLPEGAVLEAAQLASAWHLSRLVALVSVARGDAPGLSAFAAAGWAVRRVASADGAGTVAAVSAAQRGQRPTLLVCVRDEAVWERPDDATLADSRAAWRVASRRGFGVRRDWLKRRARHASRVDFDAAVSGRLPPAWQHALNAPMPVPAAADAASTSDILRHALPRLMAAMPELIQIAAPAEGLARLSRGLADAASGAALHGGIVPVLAGRLSALPALDAALRVADAGGRRLLAVVEEASAGADGAGRRAALRAMPFLPVYRPADASEAMECTDLAFRHAGPGVLLVANSPAEPLADWPSRLRCVKGGYVLVESVGKRAGTLIASGPEIGIALMMQDLLAERELETAVVSLPCWHAFFRQEPAWQERVLGSAPRIGLEPGCGFGWDRILGADGLFIGLAAMPPALWAADQRDAAATRAAEIAARHIERRNTIWTGPEASPKRTAFGRPG